MKAEAGVGAGQQLAEREGTSQSTIARLDSGTAKPSISTPERTAKATGTRVRISLEPTAQPRDRGPRRGIVRPPRAQTDFAWPLCANLRVG